MIGGKHMRGVETRIQEIRHRIFRRREWRTTEWRNGMAGDKRIEELPHKIIPGEVGNLETMFFWRGRSGASVPSLPGGTWRTAGHRIRHRYPGNRGGGQTGDILHAAAHHRSNLGSNASGKAVYVTDGCQGCLAHPCVEVCPKDAVSLDRTNGRSRIDPDKCIKCGQCANVCAYHAIIIQERPCAAACGMDAIHSDENGKADINYDKCVSC